MLCQSLNNKMPRYCDIGASLQKINFAHSPHSVCWHHPSNDGIYKMIDGNI